jgi:hypothetical protein
MLFPFSFMQNQGFDSDYQAVLNYATSLGYALPSLSQQGNQNTLLRELKSYGIWNKLDSFCVFANDGGSNFALIDWKRLSLYTAVNSPTFTINSGFLGNGTSSYIDTNFNISTGTNYTLNNASRNWWAFDSGSGTGGALDGLSPSNYTRTSFFDNAMQLMNSTLLSSTNVIMNLYGWRGFYRSGLNDIANSWFDGTMSYVAHVQTSTALVSSNMLIFRNSAGFGGRRRFAFYSLGGNFTSAENLLYYTAFNKYRLTL